MAQESDADKLDDCKPSDAELLALFREFCDLTEKVEVAVADRDEEICWRLGLPFAKDGVSAAEHKFRMKGYSAQADRIRAEMPAVSDQIKALDDLALLPGPGFDARAAGATAAARRRVDNFKHAFGIVDDLQDCDCKALGLPT
jgi:hypothetical protein